MVEVKIIDVTDYNSKFDGIEHVLVDVREQDEYEGGHLPGAVNLPLSGFQETYQQIPGDKAVVLVCKSGGRSQMAAEFLSGTGKYTDLTNLDGGTMGWVEAGNQVEK